MNEDTGFGRVAISAVAVEDDSANLFVQNDEQVHAEMKRRSSIEMDGDKKRRKNTNYSVKCVKTDRYLLWLVPKEMHVETVVLLEKNKKMVIENGMITEFSRAIFIIIVLIKLVFLVYLIQSVL